MPLYQVAIAILFSYLDPGMTDYSLEVKVHSYINPSHRDANGYCCYLWSRTQQVCYWECPNTFNFCPFNTSQPAGLVNCPLGMQSFEGNDSIAGLDRILIFNGTSWPGYLNMSIQVSYLYNSWHNVNQFIIQNVPITVGNNFTAVTAYKGIHQNGNVSLSFRVTCKQNFSGSSCNTLCPDVGCNGGYATSPCVNGGICTDATTYLSAPGSAGHLCTRPTPSSGDDVVESSQALAPVIEGVVVSLVVMVTLVAVGAIIIAGYIIHKRSKNHRVRLGTSCSDASHNPTYDQNAVGVVKSTSPPLQAEVHNPIYSSDGVVDAKENTVHVCDYELPVMKYEVIEDCKEKEQNSTYATIGPEPVYYGV